MVVFLARARAAPRPAVSIGGAGAELSGTLRHDPIETARRGCSASTILVTLTRARGAASRSRFHFLVSAARPSRRRRGRTALASLRRRCRGGRASRHRRWPPVPPLRRRGLRVNHSRHPHARARRRFQIAVSFFSFSSATEFDGAAVGRRWRASAGAAAAAELRRHRRWPPVPRSAVGGSASTILVTLTRARGAASRSRFHFLVSAARPSRRWPPVPPLRRRGLRRVLALDFQAGFPAGAVVLFIHWRVAADRRGRFSNNSKNKATAITSGRCSTLSRQVQFQRTSTRQHWKCKDFICSSTNNGSHPRSHSRGQEFCRNPSRPSQLAD